MKNYKKYLANLIFCGFIALTSSCMTTLYTSSNHLTGTKSDKFTPKALYKSKHDDGLAVEGKLVKADGNNPTIAYVIIPKKVIIAAHMQSKGNVTFDDIQSLSVQQKDGISVRDKIGADYEWVANVSGQGNVNVNQRTTLNFQTFGMLPFTLTIDAVTFPLQAIVLTDMQRRGRFHGPE